MIYLHGLGHFHPENKVDNEFIESLDIGTTSQWIEERVGIRSRRTVLSLDYIRATKNRDLRAAREASLYTNAETGRRAALMAIERAGISPSDIRMVVSGSSSADTCAPAEASRIANALGLSVPAFDLQAACATFGAHLHFLEQMGHALPEYVLVVCPENMTRMIDFSDRSTSVLFGDGTAAAVVSTRVPSRARVVNSTFGAAPEGCDEITVHRVAHFRQNGAAVQKFAIKKMSELLADIQKRIDHDDQSRLIYIGHQANLRMLETVCKRADIPPERHLMNIVDFGNQAAAGAPVVLSQNWEKFKPGDIVGLVVVGAGLAWSSMEIRFN